MQIHSSSQQYTQININAGTYAKTRERTFINEQFNTVFIRLRKFTKLRKINLKCFHTIPRIHEKYVSFCIDFYLLFMNTKRYTLNTLINILRSV